MPMDQVCAWKIERHSFSHVSSYSKLWNIEQERTVWGRLIPHTGSFLCLCHYRMAFALSMYVIQSIESHVCTVDSFRLFPHPATWKCTPACTGNYRCYCSKYYILWVPFTILIQDNSKLLPFLLTIDIFALVAFLFRGCMYFILIFIVTKRYFLPDPSLHRHILPNLGARLAGERKLRAWGMKEKWGVSRLSLYT